ncbi:hypothetical protein DPMN_099015 [Dreissena polymorpha]|uniref:Uncharacterized protein n=1 Tax=Dreissena polymorpha TaxID=45954 RepID=A0A9D4R797_DREPO|nr:hypothetical protein DPMN_099015 [Dreissena polymorpha]
MLLLGIACWNRILKAFANRLDPDETPQNVAHSHFHLNKLEVSTGPVADLSSIPAAHLTTIPAAVTSTKT